MTFEDLGPPADGPLAAPSATRRRGELVVLAVVAVLVVLAAIGFATRDDDSRGLLARPAGGGCLAMVDQPAGSAEHRPGEIEYAYVPPSSGPHNGAPLTTARQVIPRDDAPDRVVERAVHNLEHGYVVVWYDDTATDEEVAAVADAARAAFLRKLLVVPWDRGAFGGPSFVLAAWGHVQPCELPDAEAIKAFWVAHGGENGEAPEARAP